MERYYIGADIGGTSIKLAFITEVGEIKEKWEIPTDTEDNGVNIPKDMSRSIHDKLMGAGFEKEQVMGIGAGAPGFINTETGFVHQAVNIGWKDYELGKILRDLTDLPVYVENDANLAALGENWKGSGNNVENLLAITLGTGVGGGVIANGSIINGANGTAGEIGHITVIPEGGAPCNCGKTGCLETVASATGMVRLAERRINEGNDTRLEEIKETNGVLTAKDIFEAAAQKDKEAIHVVNDVADILGMTIANLAIVCNPSKIVIGGGVSQAGEQLLQPLRESFTRFALPRTNEAAEFVLAELGNDAGVIGGAFLVKEHIG
ncbi:ROK family glucokinase [Thalassobacillus pellis]|uniref:ROK family glucokinase n=1 Tax=Thalassobacillus pellis TaxID=748008 RepID=UPI001EF82BA0|nr:ROK family glucokinase [Thalassobacillus pellis]MBM7552289.1 glucokinase [Thalassobacillus pellis]